MSDSNNLDDLKNQLSALLAQGSTDFQGIIRIAGEIAKQEPGVVRFSTDAAMVRRLGRELVAKQETALAELVKNAYDADATHCAVTMDDSETGAIEILDDGSGMSRSDIENGFMRLASDVKVRVPLSPKFGRPRAGKKGIGRFATERLGRRLTIVTQTERETHGWTVNVDWTAFVQGDDINLIANSIVESEKEQPHGTRLRIETLSDTWSKADLQRVYRYVLTLLQPVFGEVETTQRVGDPGFLVKITKGAEDLEEETIVLDTDSEVFGRAVAEIEARIDAEGKAIWWLSSNKFDLPSNPEPIGLDANGADRLSTLEMPS